MKLKVKVHEQCFDVEIEDLHSRPILATVDGETFEVWPETQTAQSAPAAETPARKSNAEGLQKQRPAASAPTSTPTIDAASVRAPIPGVITAILVEAGSEVSYGQVLCKLEAMKMNNSIRATHPGKIASVHIAVGQQVKHHDLLIEFAKN